MKQVDHFNKNTPYRFERKFTATAAHRSEFIFQIKKHPAFFREVYHSRQVNNIYFDTPGLQFFNDNIIGVAERKKVRIRWYGDVNGKIISPKLEYKIKSGLLGTKWTFDLVDFELGSFVGGSPLYPPQGRGVKTFSLKKYISDIFQKSNLPAEIIADLKMLSPTLINSYQRTYFLSADKKYRLTFDEGLKYYRPSAFRHTSPCHPVRNCSSITGSPYSRPNVNRSFQDGKLGNALCEKNRFILELKYGQNEDHSANNISRLFPYRLDKSSKYVNGMELLS